VIDEKFAIELELNKVAITTVRRDKTYDEFMKTY